MVFNWLSSGTLRIPFALRLDQLSALMILVITGIGSLIHIYSTGYMHEETDSEYARYFSYLNLFASFMLVLVLGSSFPVMFVGWEGVGLCSYLLIGFYYTKQSASDAGKKAFVVNRIGDFGFILGMLLIFVTFGTLDFQAVAAGAAERAPETLGMGVMTMATLLLFVGATGKSAQLPLHVWLPDAMEGPTPVSALIHAATMVTAGVYMIGRNAVLFSHAPMTLEVVAAIGVATALMAGTIGLVQNDIKRVLAYSTVSQLGYMFLAMGVGAYAAGIFHLYTHAFFKALLFLGSGAVIHALAGEQDLRNMGGLRKYLPVTYWTFMIGALAIAGVPLLSGFFSKDEILYKTFVGTQYSHGSALLWVIGAITSLLTAIYMFRLVHLAFHGERRTPAAAHAGHGHADAHGHGGGHGHGAPHDAPPSMAIPLIILAIGSIVAGYVGIPHALGGHNHIEGFLEPAFEVHQTAEAGQPTAAAEPAAPPVPAAPSVSEASPVALAGQSEAGHATGAVPGDIAHRAHADGDFDRHRARRHRHRVLLLAPAAVGARGDRTAVQRRAPPAPEQVLPRRDLQRGHRPADQAGVDRRPLEGRGRGRDRRLGQRRRGWRAEPQLVAAPSADRFDPHLRGVALPRCGAGPGMVPVDLRFDAAGCRVMRPVTLGSVFRWRLQTCSR